MKLLLIFFILLLSNCSKPKTVFICGDHICINKSEANAYFEENLTIEVQVISKNKKEEPDLVKLNMMEDAKNVRKISLEKKDNIEMPMKTLSKNEVKKIKAKLKLKEKGKKELKKVSKKNDQALIVTSTSQERKEKKITKKINDKKFNLRNENQKDVFDICTKIENCNIEEISKYLIKLGKNKKFPKITTRE